MFNLDSSILVFPNGISPVLQTQSTGNSADLFSTLQMVATVEYFIHHKKAMETQSNSTCTIAILLMAVIYNAKFVMFLYLLFTSFALTTSDDADDVRTLHAFRDSILDPLGSLSSWNSNIGPCIKPLWIGIKCQAGQVFAIQLEGMGLSGRLDLDVLTPLLLLRTLSFMNNNFSGPLPNLKNFQGLKNVLFSMNNFEGEIPDDAFDGMQSLKKINLSMIGFTGRIPSSLTRVNSLSGLWLNDNGFVGEIPDFEQTGLLAFNVSNNHLEGRIPDKLSKLDPSNFSGNKNICGPPTKLLCEESADPDLPPN